MLVRCRLVAFFALIGLYLGQLCVGGVACGCLSTNRTFVLLMTEPPKPLPGYFAIPLSPAASNAVRSPLFDQSKAGGWVCGRALFIVINYRSSRCVYVRTHSSARLPLSAPILAYSSRPHPVETKYLRTRASTCTTTYTQYLITHYKPTPNTCQSTSCSASKLKLPPSLFLQTNRSLGWLMMGCTAPSQPPTHDAPHLVHAQLKSTFPGTCTVP